MNHIDYPGNAHEMLFEIEDRNFWFQHRNKVITTVIKRYPPKGFIMDIGGGNGIVSKALHESGFKTVLAEPNSTAVQLASKRGISDIVQTSLEEFELKKCSLPAAGLFDVLEHLAHPQGLLKKVYEWLTNDGYLYVTVPTYQFLWSSDDEYAEHQRRYTTSLLVEECKTAGFKELYVSYFFASLVIPIYLFRTLPSKINKRSIEKPSYLIGSGFMNEALKLMLSIELLFKKLPFGTSCIGVFQK